MGWRPEDSGHRMAGSRPDGDVRGRWLVMVLSVLSILSITGGRPCLLCDLEESRCRAVQDLSWRHELSKHQGNAGE